MNDSMTDRLSARLKKSPLLVVVVVVVFLASPSP